MICIIVLGEELPPKHHSPVLCIPLGVERFSHYLVLYIAHQCAMITHHTCVVMTATQMIQFKASTRRQSLKVSFTIMDNVTISFSLTVGLVGV